MTITTITSRKFNQHASDAKKASLKGPVFITGRGRPAHVLLSIEEYRRLTGQHTTLLDAVAQKEGSDFDFEPPRVENLPRPADLG